MARVPLDPNTGDLVRRLFAAARRNGIDAAEALNDKGLLLTPQRRQQLRMEALQELLKMVESWRPAEYLRRVNKDKAPTPKDMYDGILGYVADYVDNEGKQ